VRYLVSRGAEINTQDVYQVRISRFLQILLVLGQALCCGAQLIYLCTKQDTPLIAASGAGKVSTVRLLLELGADKTIRNELVPLSLSLSLSLPY